MFQSKQASATDNRTSITLSRSLAGLIHTNRQVMQNIQVMHNHVNAKKILYETLNATCG